MTRLLFRCLLFAAVLAAPQLASAGSLEDLGLIRVEQQRDAANDLIRIFDREGTSRPELELNGGNALAGFLQMFSGGERVSGDVFVYERQPSDAASPLKP